METQIILSSNPDNLEKALAQFENTGTVEAEYGDRVVEGSLVTLAHHGPRKKNPCPCLQENCDFEQAEALEAIGLSHIDLDALGGVMALLGQKPSAPDFWDVAAYVDVHGPHKLVNWRPEESAYDDAKNQLAWRQLHAFWAWSEKNRIYAPRDGSVEDVTEKVKVAFESIREILAGDPEMLKAGQEFADAERMLNNTSWVGQIGPVIVRRSESFVNHLYTDPIAQPQKAVTALNPKTGAVTISLAEPCGISCREFVQKLWGPEAGGHDGIAGSPRNWQMTEADLYQAAHALCDALGY